MPDTLTATTRIVLADDHEVVRTGLRLLLGGQPDLEVVGEAGSADGALELVAVLEPDVLVLDLSMPGRPSLDVLPELRERHPATAVVILTMHADPAFARSALAAGASGFVLKDAAEHELKAAIRTVAEGGTFLNPELGARLARERSDRPAADELSPREVEVLRLIALGYTNAETGRALDISVRTIETHRVHIAQKLGCTSRSQLVRYALDRGLLA